MLLPKQLKERCNSFCEICTTLTPDIIPYLVPPKKEEILENLVALCNDCYTQISNADYNNTNYWRCITGSIWSEVLAVQALSYKILQALKNVDWAIETLDGIFIDESIVEWANAEAQLVSNQIIHKDSYGNILETGDTVILIQNLNIKGANYIAPKGTTVRKIRLVPDNSECIEGKIEGDTIVILTKYVRKSL